MSEKDFNARATPAEPFSRKPDATNAANEGGPSDPGEWQRLKHQSSELLEYLSYYLHAKADGLKLTGRNLLFHIRLEIVAILVIAGTMLVAVTLIFVGVAQGLAQLFGDEPWLGHVVAGLLLLGGAGFGAWLWNCVGEKKSYNKTVQEYEQRKHQQQARFGHDVAERAQGTHSKE
jgi:hypothetical protein